MNENEKAILNSLEEIKQSILAVKEIVSSIPRKKLPVPYGYNPMGKRKFFSRRLAGAFRSPEVREFVLQTRRGGQSYKNIAFGVKEHWPGQPEKHPSRSAIHRFCADARNGRLREFGIKGDE
ncbi:MAG: hypothetical protein ACOYOS_01625 [Syntrophales bacterium]